MTTPGQDDVSMGEPQAPEWTEPQAPGQAAAPLFVAPAPLPNQPSLVRLQATTKPPTLSNGAFRKFPKAPPSRPPNDPNPRPPKRPREYEENHPILEANFGNVATSAKPGSQTATQMAGRPPNMANIEAGLIDATRQLAQPRPPPELPQSNAPPATPHQNEQSSPPPPNAPRSTFTPPNNTLLQPNQRPTSTSQSQPSTSRQNASQPNSSQPPKPSPQSSNNPPSNASQTGAGRPNTQRADVMDTDGDADDEDFGGGNANNVDL
ncbi:hypothetical protein FRC07_013858, partial [Ceratobasidium sp. 392]